MQVAARLAAAFVVSLGLSGGAGAQETNLAVENGWARATPPGVSIGAGYGVLVNEGDEADRLVGVEAGFAGRAEVHRTTMDDGRMTMRPVEGGLELPAGERVTLEPGGLHIMFHDLEAPLEAGDSLPVTLVFEEAGRIRTELVVAPIGAREAPATPDR